MDQALFGPAYVIILYYCIQTFKRISKIFPQLLSHYHLIDLTPAHISSTCEQIQGSRLSSMK